MYVCCTCVCVLAVSRALSSFSQALGSKIDDHLAAALAGDALASLSAMKRLFKSGVGPATQGMTAARDGSVQVEHVQTWLRPARRPLQLIDVDDRSVTRVDLLKSAVYVQSRRLVPPLHLPLTCVCALTVSVAAGTCTSDRRYGLHPPRVVVCALLEHACC